MNNKIVIAVVVTAVIAGGIGYWGGSAYGKPAQMTPGQFNRMGGLAGGAGRVRGGAGGAAGAGFVTGTILSKDAQSITVQMQDGSKIVFVSGTTQVSKTAAGSLADLIVGERVVVTGTTNSDGSVTASSIQLRPEQAR